MSKKQRKNLSDPRLRLEDLLLDDSFIRFIKDLATAEERKYWQVWQRQHPDNQILVEHAKELMQFTAGGEERIPEPHAELKKFEESLKKSSIHSKKHREMNAFRIRKRSRSFWLVTAVALVLMVVSTGIFVNMDMNRVTGQSEEIAVMSKSEHQTGFGEKAFLHLSDGSRIVLNANSHLTYSWTGSDGTGQNVDIHLEGEAWFDIEPHTGEESRFFRVHTSEGIVEVTGTVFAVQTSPKGTRAVLEEGEIRINRQAASSEQTSKILQPGEMAQIIPGNDRIELEKVNPKIYTSWIGDTWMFEQTPLNQISERIEMVFGVRVDIPSAELREKTLSGTISSTNLQLIKEGLSEALREPVVQDGNKIIIGPK